MTLGIIANLSYYYEIAEILVAAERAAASAGYVMLIADTADFVGRGEVYHRLLSERRVDGLLVASILVGDEFVKEHGREDLPFVLLNRRARGIALSSSVDDARGVQVAVEHLAALGHKRIGYVAGQTSTEPVRRRLAGFRAGLRTTGLRAHRSLIMESPVDGEGVFCVTQELLSHTPRATALVVWSPTAAVPALAAARRSGLQLPEDLSVVSYNDSPIAGYLDPPLTTVRMPLAEMAQQGVDCLLRTIAGERVSSVVVEAPPVLVERGSTAPLSHTEA